MRLLKSTVNLALFVAVASITVNSLHAEPASWYKWRSKLNAHQVCSQTSPGEGWEQLPKAYSDARCERPK